MAVTIIKNGKAYHINSNVSQYTGEKTGGEFDHSQNYGTSPTDFVRESYGILASRCATLYHTASVARAVVEKPLTYSIGKGLFFKSMPDFDFLGISEPKAKAWGRKFTKLLHYEKKAVKWYKKQKQIAREAKITGDAVLYFIREGQKSGVPFDLVVTQGSAIDWEKSDKNHTLGIKHDMYNRRVGFESSTSKKTVPFMDKDGNQVAIQFLFPGRCGQLRGFGVYMSEIAKIKNLDRMWDSILERINMEATQLGYFNASKTDIPKQAKEMAKRATRRGTKPAEVTIKQVDAPTPTKVGGMYIMDNEESMTINEMKTPSNNFGTANEWSLNFFSMAANLPPEVVLGKYSTSYTAHKGAFNDFLKVVEEDRQAYIDGVESTVDLEYLKHFVRTNQLTVRADFWTDYKVQMAYLAGMYLGPVPGHINPFQEVKADELAVKNGFNLQSNITAKNGVDFWNSIDTWAEEQQKWWDLTPENKAELLFQEEKRAAVIKQVEEGKELQTDEKPATPKKATRRAKVNNIQPKRKVARRIQKVGS